MTDKAEPGASHGGQRVGHGRVIAASISAAVGAFLFGFDSAVINGAVDSLSAHFALSSFVEGFAVAVALLGCAVGAWYAGQLADRLGRKRVMVLGAVLFLLSSIGSGIAFTVWDLMLWRIIGGIGIGIASVISPAYISEIAPAKIRGALTSVHQLAITIGIFAALLSDALVAHTAGGAGDTLWLGAPAWRWMFLIGAIPAIVYGILSLLIPESPRYLVRAGKDIEAARVLRSVVGDPDPDRKIVDIRSSLHQEARTSFRDIKGHRFGLKPLVWVGIILAGLQQLVGINAIFYYSTTLWKSVGFSESDSFITSVITSVINVALTFVAIIWVDKFGRRLLLLIGSCGMFVGLGAASLSFFHAVGSGDNISLPEPWGIIALIGANLFVIFFAATWGPLVWVLLGEMFPNNMRSYALAIGAVGNWLCNFLVSVSFPFLAQHIGLGTVYCVYAAFAVISFFFVKSKIPETTGAELEHMTGKTLHESN
ncbi:sugar porter family MFS transporter [Spelaeicoccus albus]|uniref:Sugar porter (SP) family MFS transporter n=1 Tax=Spelaeicoccus albus TaxID=1280376 RepID=A0A7Z0D1R8_9MICO|nr:sugar porter family MFS transporter [Spelaeicoccus albus]NYI66732.1 sugar porter (SP) family MFS transporter [Spelaeicoccus albus]